MTEMPEHAIELKPCPFCGQAPIVVTKEYKLSQTIMAENDITCDNDSCIMWPRFYTLDDWNTRPIEDQLRAALAASEARAVQLRYVINEVASTLITYIDQDSKEGAVMRKAYEDLMEVYDGNYSTVPPDK